MMSVCSALHSPSPCVCSRTVVAGYNSVIHENHLESESRQQIWCRGSVSAAAEVSRTSIPIKGLCLLNAVSETGVLGARSES